MRPKTVVMYHYIREIFRTSFPRLHVRTPAEFDCQLQHLASNYAVTGMEAFAGTSGAKPTALLTFDDGLKDHSIEVFPRLQAMGLKGAFFVSSGPLVKPIVLDVHKIQLLLGSQPLDEIYRALVSSVGKKKVLNYQKRGVPSTETQRYDSERVVVVKRLLQRDLEQPARSEILDRIFCQFFPGQERDISAELYMSLSELRTMKAAGMHIGNHSVSHPWLGFESTKIIESEIFANDHFLLEEGLMEEGLKTLAYPYGNLSHEVETILQQAGYNFAFTTEPQLWDPLAQSRLRVPRLDTNDLPFG